jgi:hypothetical protein
VGRPRARPHRRYFAGTTRRFHHSSGAPTDDRPAPIAESNERADYDAFIFGTPYGASCVTGAGDELRMPSALELEMCSSQGEHVARLTAQFVRGRTA